MKTISQDRTYVDYTTPKFGVRVRRAACRNVFHTPVGWEEYGEEFSLPVEPKLIDSSRTEGPSYDLSMNVIDYESFGARLCENAKELRAVLLGEIGLDVVVSDGPKYPFGDP